MNQSEEHRQLAEDPGMRGQAPRLPAPPLSSGDPAASADHAEPVVPAGAPAHGDARIEPITPHESASQGPPEAAPPPPAPAEPPQEAGFEADGEKWIARPAGVGSYGTGITARASVLAIHFFRHVEPDRPAREVLTGTGSFEMLYEEELRELLARSRPIVER